MEGLTALAAELKNLARVGDAMNVIRTIMNVLPEKQKEVLQTLLSLAVSQEKEQGCRSYCIYSDIEDDNVFNLISEWETNRQLDHHMQSDGFSILLGTKSLLFKPMEIQIFTTSDTEGMEAVNTIRKKMKQVFPI